MNLDGLKEFLNLTVNGKAAVVLPDEKEISEWLSGKEKDSSQVTPDPYLTHYDPENEHEAFRAAEKRAEKRHRERITTVSSYIPLKDLDYAVTISIRSQI